jgi:hypothetical protein
MPDTLNDTKKRPLLKLQRVAQSDKGTFGVLVWDNVPLCVTLEDPWNNNFPNVSCIPAKTYEVKPWNGNKYKNVWEVTKVPGRSAILIHQGNSIKDTEGCILVGESFSTLGGMPSITRSLVTLDRLRAILPKEFTLEIKE